MTASTGTATTQIATAQGGEVTVGGGSRIEKPDNIAAVIAEVLTARDFGQSVSVAAHGYPQPSADGAVILDLSQLTGLQDADPKRNEVTFFAGTTVGQATELLSAQGLAMIGAPDDPALTLAGAAATGAHGFNPAEPIFSGAIVGISFVTLRGELKPIDERRNPELWSAAKLSLGSIGVPVTVTVKVRPYAPVQLRHRRRNIHELLGEFAEARSKVDFYRVDWRPQSDSARLTVGWFAAPGELIQVDEKGAGQQLALTTGASRRPKPSRFRRFREAIARKVPFLAPAIARVANRFEHFGERTDDTGRTLHGATIEYYFAARRMPSLIEGLSELARLHRGLASAEVRISLVAPDDAWVSPGYRAETVAVALSVPESDVEALADVEELFIWLGGLPNWGYFSTLTGPEAAHVMPRFGDFMHTSADLDPHGQLRNDLISRLRA